MKAKNNQDQQNTKKPKNAQKGNKKGKNLKKQGKGGQVMSRGNIQHPKKVTFKPLENFLKRFREQEAVSTQTILSKYKDVSRPKMPNDAEKWRFRPQNLQKKWKFWFFLFFDALDLTLI